MNPFSLRLTKRLAVLAIGTLAIYIALRLIFPFIDRRLRVPDAIGLFLTYVLMAYVILPGLIRLIHVFIRPKHIPIYSLTPDGFASDPINIGLIGSREEIIQAMTTAGWFLADKRSFKTLARALIATALRRNYPSAPFSNLILFGRKQDLGFEVGVSGKAYQRHHVRFWACNLSGPEEFQETTNFWQRLNPPEILAPERQLWVGAASKDVGFAPIRYNAQITHMIAPDTNAERDLIVKDLKSKQLVASSRNIVVGKPYSLRNRALRGSLNSDGRLTICELKNS